MFLILNFISNEMYIMHCLKTCQLWEAAVSTSVDKLWCFWQTPSAHFQQTTVSKHWRDGTQSLATSYE